MYKPETGRKARSGRSVAEFSALTEEQQADIESHWNYLIEAHHLNYTESNGTSYIRQPGQLFDYDGIALDPLMQSQNGHPAVVTTVCTRLNCKCMYLESRSVEALKFLHWKYYKP